MRKRISALLTLALTLSLCACTPSAPPDGEVQITNDGLALSVPAKYRDLLIIDLESGFPERKMHFRVSEKASVDAGGGSGGFLFGIGRVTEEEFRNLMCGEMTGSEVFAVDADGNYYMYYHPTDVQLLRDGECTQADWDIWSELCEWATGMPDRFIADHPGLTPLRRSNSILDIYLNRLLHWQNFPFTLTHSSTSTDLSPSDKLSLPYLEQLTACQVSDAGTAAVPDGEYITLYLPGEDARFDFFLDDSGLFRAFFFDGSSALFRIDCDSGIPAGQIVLDWYNAAKPQ